MAAVWEKVRIVTEEGEREAVAPVVVSASRATDVPAFHAKWLVERLEAGYCRWVNPFNGREQYVSFGNARAWVFWTKDARPMLEHLGVFDGRGMAYYFQFTLNDYAAEGLEPGVRPVEERVRTFVELAGRIGKERVIWRFDPLMLGDGITVDVLAEKVRWIGERLQGHTEKLVISFADLACYARVRRRLAREGMGLREFTGAEMEEMAGRIAEMAKGWEMAVATCCEAVELERFGIGHNRCIDGELLLRITGNDPELVKLLGREGRGRSDPGQREGCGCAPSKDIGAYDTCGHGCVYCYACRRGGGDQCVIRET